MKSLDREKFYTRLFAAFQSMQKTMVPPVSALDKRLPLAQRVMLFTISIHGPTNVKHLSQVLHITSGAVTQTVDALVQAGWIDKTVDSKDRRGVVINLSDNGVELMQMLQRDSMKMMNDLFDEVTDEELKQLVTIYEKIGKSKRGKNEKS